MLDLGISMFPILRPSPVQGPSWKTWDGSLDGSFVPIANSADFEGVCKFDTDRSLALYLDSITGVLNAIVVTTSGTTPTNHNPQPLDSSARFQGSLCALDNTRVLICYITTTGMYAVVASIDASNVITLGTPRQINTDLGNASPRVLKLATDQCILSYSNFEALATFNATCITTSGTTVDAPHAILPIETYGPLYYNIGILSASSVFLAYNADDAGNGINGIVLTIASNTVSKFSSHPLVSSSVNIPDLLSCYTYDSQYAIVIYEDYNAAKCYAFVVTITDNSGNMSAGNSREFYDGNATGNGAGSSNPLCLIDNTTFIALFSSFSPSPNAGQACVLTVSGTTVIPSDVVDIYNNSAFYLTGALLDANRILIGGYESGGATAGTQVLSIV